MDCTKWNKYRGAYIIHCWNFFYKNVWTQSWRFLNIYLVTVEKCNKLIVCVRLQQTGHSDWINTVSYTHLILIMTSRVAKIPLPGAFHSG